MAGTDRERIRPGERERGADGITSIAYRAATCRRRHDRAIVQRERGTTEREGRGLASRTIVRERHGAERDYADVIRVGGLRCSREEQAPGSNRGRLPTYIRGDPVGRPRPAPGAGTTRPGCNVPWGCGRAHSDTCSLSGHEHGDKKQTADHSRRQIHKIDDLWRTDFSGVFSDGDARGAYPESQTWLYLGVAAVRQMRGSNPMVYVRERAASTTRHANFKNFRRRAKTPKTASKEGEVSRVRWRIASDFAGLRSRFGNGHRQTHDKNTCFGPARPKQAFKVKT